MSQLFDSIEDVVEPVVDLNVAKRTLMLASGVRAVALAVGVGVGAAAMKIKPSTAVKAAVIPAVIELGATYLGVSRASEVEILDKEATVSNKSHLNDAAVNFIAGAVAIVGGAVIARVLKGPETPAE
ncbi:hypothetical protein FDH97_gp145 [Erwinia phage vB_EamM_Deimos-Minion]|uniref:Uncharacterized protein n=1 Tax=Erwinia phage vB_EamM_Deimos-Minion TaxID=1815986 RepID=A0A173GF73_9CAUD|nr:hypothetical protein FDH97_gp145 [Erwinia phage vB_EamM_Deimos-Minion]ANH52243.1 hypothetical protein DM_145 [Erwinia phage vB_EamM_Deimos-Minion]